MSRLRREIDLVIFIQVYTVNIYLYNETFTHEECIYYLI